MFSHYQRKGMCLLLILLTGNLYLELYLKSRSKAEAIPISESSIPTFLGKPQFVPFQFEVNSVKAYQLNQLPGLSTALSKRIVNYRNAKGGYVSLEELKKVYGMSEQTYEDLIFYLRIIPSQKVRKKYVMNNNYYHAHSKRSFHKKDSSKHSYPIKTPPPLASVNLNQADSLSLIQIPGIGPKLSIRIIRFRKLIGHFCKIDQLKNIYGLSEENYHRMAPYLRIEIPDSINLKDLNLASRKSLGMFGSIDSTTVDYLWRRKNNLRRISSWKQLKEEDGLSDESLTKVKCYFEIRN